VAAAWIEGVGSDSDVVIAIDVLSFTTAVETAGSRDFSEFPYPGRDSPAEQYAGAVGAELASSAL
jgi:hypothetical protein